MPQTAKKLIISKVKTTKPAAPTARQVLAYLQANPSFFEKYKEELATSFASGASTPKKGRMGGGIVSLHAAKAERVARDAENLKIRHHQLISTAKGNADVAESIFTAVLGLIACQTLADLRKYLQGPLAEQLQTDAIRLFKVSAEETATTLTTDQIKALCPQTIVTGPLNAAAHRVLFGPKTNQIKSVCLMTLATEDQTHGLLVLGSSEATRFHAGQATTLADFLRRATTQVLVHVR